MVTFMVLPLFSSTVTYGKTKKLIDNAGRLVSPKKCKGNRKNKKVGKAGKIYNCRHFPSRMRPEFIIYMVDHNFEKYPSKDELEEYYRDNFFEDGIYNCNDWKTKERMINYLAGILMTNYYLAGKWNVFRQVGYTIIDVLLFRNARERVDISARRFLDNKSGSCWSISCYLLLFLERLGVEARLAFFTFPGAYKDCHVGIVFKKAGNPGKWFLLDPVYAITLKKELKMEKYELDHLLVLEEIKRDDKRKISEMRCAEVKKGKVISDSILSKNGNYTHKVPSYFNW